MQNLDVKLDKITVGVAAHSDPLKRNKGITLIALIITIIVMLILVGVTINVALNGGLFTKAEDAAIGTEKQAIYEQIVSNMELTNDGKISVKGTFDKVIAEFGADKVTNINPATVDETTTEVTFSIVGKTGTYSYKISTTEIEKDPVENPLQTGGLVSGNVYSDSEEINICFSEKYGIVFSGKDFANMDYFSYDQQNKTIEYGEVIFNLSDDGKNITATLYGEEINLQLTEENLFDQYSTEYLSEIDAYSGVYYADTNKKSISIYVDEEEAVWANIGGNSDYLSVWGITVVDETHIERDGVQYTLLKTLE